jgi:hypothetical protein
VLNGISEGGPNLVMRFKAKAKIRAETAWDGGLEVGIRCNSICAPLQERRKMLQAGTRHDGENLIAIMEMPGEAVAHIHQWRETAMVDDSRRINSVRQGRKCRCLVDSQKEGFVHSVE